MSQYYIARIRYQNPLPPPLFPPKLLNIPTPIDHYTTPEYTSTLAQQQPQNIDIDVEGGMPLDLAIIPGLFEGDESGIIIHNNLSWKELTCQGSMPTH
jgi:RNA polymerase II-associated factor 1